MPPRAVRFYTGNPGKVREARATLAPFGFQVRHGRKDFVEPQADSLEEVARAKLAQAPLGRELVMVEDAGIFVESCRGFPGVYSAYVLRTLGPGGLLRLVRGPDRRATFVAVIGVRWPSGKVRLFRGESRGRLSTRVRGEHGFGFDPVFIPQGATRTFAEMELEEKREVSHRARALKAMVRFLARQRA